MDDSVILIEDYGNTHDDHEQDNALQENGKDDDAIILLSSEEPSPIKAKKGTSHTNFTSRFDLYLNDDLLASSSSDDEASSSSHKITKKSKINTFGSSKSYGGISTPSNRSMTRTIIDNQSSSFAVDNSSEISVVQEEAQKLSSKEAKAREKEAAKLSKLKEKEAAKEAQEAKRKIRELNFRRDKDDVSSELIVVLNESFAKLPVGISFETNLKESGFPVEISPFPTPYSISFKRMVKSRFDKEAKSFLPASEKVVPEPFCVFYWTDKSILPLISEESAESIIEKERREWRLGNLASARIIHIIEGSLTRAKSEKQNLINRAFKETVRNIDNPGSGAGTGVVKTRKKQTSSDPPKSMVSWTLDEDILLEWSLQPNVRLIKTKNMEESVESLLETCYQIGLQPYNQSVEASKVQFGIFTNAKSGLDLSDTWRKFLETIPRLNDEKAKAIVSRYPTIYSLMAEYLEGDGGASLLEDIQTEKNRRVGPSISKAVYRFFTEKDPNKVFSA